MVVRQQEATGCGIASVANLLGITYADAKLTANRLGIYAEDKSLFSDTAYLRNLLQTYDVPISEHEIPFKSWDSLPDTALLSIRFHINAGRPFWHWVVFKRIDGIASVFDSAMSLKDNVRTDFEAMQPEWFIEVFET